MVYWSPTDLLDHSRLTSAPRISLSEMDLEILGFWGQKPKRGILLRPCPLSVHYSIIGSLVALFGSSFPLRYFIQASVLWAKRLRFLRKVFITRKSIWQASAKVQGNRSRLKATMTSSMYSFSIIICFIPVFTILIKYQSSFPYAHPCVLILSYIIPYAWYSTRSNTTDYSRNISYIVYPVPLGI